MPDQQEDTALLPATIQADEWREIASARGDEHPYLDLDVIDDPPTYVACTGDDFIEAGDDLDVLLAEVADVPADLAVWRGDALAAVIQAGVVTVFEPATANDRPKGGTRKRKPVPQIFGRAVTAILIWMGKRQWTFSEARGVLLRLGVKVAGANVGRLIRAGRSGKLRAVRLEDEYVRQLEGLRELVVVGGS
jgi:hypothetical protein